MSAPRWLHHSLPRHLQKSSGPRSTPRGHHNALLGARQSIGAAISPSTLSRFFTGRSLPPLNTLQGVVKALGGTDQDLERCRAYWVAAAQTLETTRKAQLAQQNDHEPAEGQIIIHSGSVYIADAAAAGGKTIVIYAGDVYLATDAANAAAQIIVHGGNVHLGAKPDNATHECAHCGARVTDDVMHQKWHDLINQTQGPAHLRRVQ